MRRSRKALLALLALTILAGIGYLLSPLSEMRWGMDQVEIGEVGRRHRFVLEPEPGTGPVFAIELHVVGELDGDAVIRLVPPSGEVLVRQRLRAGTVKAEYRGDWYNQGCELVYEPDGAAQGALTVYYAFDRLK